MKPILSPTIHESMIARHGDIEHDADLRDLYDGAAACRGACERSIDAAEKIRANRMAAPLANERQLRSVSFKHFGFAASKVDAARDHAVRLIRKLDAETAAPPLPKDPAGLMLATEIRGALKNMSREDRGAAIAKAIEGGDDVLVGAVLNAPAMLSGMGVEDLEMRRASWRSKRYGAEVARIDRLKKAVADLERIGILSRKFIDGLTDAAEIAAAEATELAAKAAAE